MWDETPADDSREQGFWVFDLTFYQTYLRCDGCNNSVFPEPIDFGDKGCRYTNRLADALADKYRIIQQALAERLYRELHGDAKQ